MAEQVKRIYVEKRPGFDVEAQSLLNEFRHNLGIDGLEAVRVINRYDVAGISDEEYGRSRGTIFAEPNADYVYDEKFPMERSDRVFAMEYLPGQYDQRADSAAQCVQLLTQKERPEVATAKVIVLKGAVSDTDFARIKAYCINPVESREASLLKPASLKMRTETPPDVPVLAGFTAKDPDALAGLRDELGLAMSAEDLAHCQAYFRDTERRDPTLTELRVLDTYWSDHCRHTTFLTTIEEAVIEEGRYTAPIRAAYRDYLAAREELYGAAQKPLCLMDIATIAMKEAKRQGLLDDLEESAEINAASIVVPVEIDGRTEEWLVMFKNETHNHPTEIEPFGGAATCLGGAIRDPLSGRSYVYLALRVTGSGDPRTPVADTLPGKLPQRKITIAAATGYSSYGNQIGLATGQVAEVYDEGFVAKRMEIGAVIGAAPRANVVRQEPVPGDAVLLVGGRTGRDGCGGATGSSKEHTEESLASCGAEVQKGNPPTERKIQRLFRHPAVSRMIKRCNDFGAGGVSVAIGELTDGLTINLDAVPKKYEGLDGTELAISESQERMAAVVAAADVAAFAAYARAENLEVTQVATVTDDRRLVMRWRGQAIVDISRDFLDTCGVRQTTRVAVAAPSPEDDFFAATPAVLDKADLKAAWLANLADLNVASQKGLVERFDSSIGAATVVMPYGGVRQSTPAEGAVAKLPVLEGETTTGTIMTYGYNPLIGKWSPFHGALYAVVEAVTKLVALGGDWRTARLTLQEYFEKLGRDPVRWGKPFSALLGAYRAQKELGVPAIGGKDSMSGTFMDLNVPPTLVAFALCPVDVRRAVSQEFKRAGSAVVLIAAPRDGDELPDFAALKANFAKIHELITAGRVLASHTVKAGGVAAAVSKMAFGNHIGFAFAADVKADELFAADYGAVILELPGDTDLAGALAGVSWRELGRTQERPVICVSGAEITLDEAFAAWERPLESIFPTRAQECGAPPPPAGSHTKRSGVRPAVSVAKPRVFIPVFPGTNCEYDSARVFVKAGALAETLVFRNLTASDVEESVAALVDGIGRSQIVMLPGGFSAGDEPDGSAKFIATVFRNPRVREATTAFLERRDGLMLGVCNGFQALIKLGLLPYGRIVDELGEADPTLTFNQIGRHVACLVRTRVASVLSPWLADAAVGDIHTIAVSHGEGRFIAPPAVVDQLIAGGQIATQYVDLDGKPSNDIRFNPNGSIAAVEGITSPDGRIFGKMAHSERTGPYVAVNVPGAKEQGIFASGVKYFR
ncbi:phosphoribosylformylglycinamidine synthase [Anaeroselena agilis]|uniref:Phosphoribosylformylglycinamidine synthase n=1 Tax=Anaeroselena agilis TaxID=3063788 RepID=A0ABU3P2G2_9FIRM|nr:phosphoribosylformylglycinamidine synthase [Selenomonadales bacterium 4137-cl]